MLLLILKSSVCLAAFMLFYKLLLEKTSTHNFKRFYLIGIILISIGIPFITFTAYIEVQSQTFDIPVLEDYPIPEHIDNIETLETIVPTKSFQDYVPSILWCIYGIGVLLFAIRFFRNLSQLIQKIRLNPKFKNKNFINVLLKDLIIPHSFFNFIFLNKTEFENNKIPLEVLLHEQIHAKQKHALDILFIEIFQILFWFNPLLYFIKKDIKLNHEFLADQAVLKQGIDSSTYLNTLLKFSSPDNYRDASLANAINYSSIKKRFTVMKLKTPKTALWFRSLIILPLLAILIYGFSDTVIIEKEIITNTISAKQQIKTNVGATQSMMDEYNEFINKFEKSKSINFSKYKRIVAIYDLMTEMQRNSVKRYPEMPGTGLTKVKPKTPTNAIFNSWKNKEEFAIWIDGKHVENTLLNTYKATGFIYYTSSFVYNNVRSERFPQPYQNSLFTKKGFEETYLKANVKKYNNLKNHFYKVKKEFIDSGNKDDSEIRLIKVQLDKLYNLLSKEEIEKYNVKSPKTLTFSNQNAQQENTSQLPSEDNKSKSSLKAVSKVKDIIIKIDRSKNIILNNKTILFKDLKKEVDKLNPDLSTEEKQKQLNGNIIIYSESFIKLAKEIKEILTKKCNVTNCQLSIFHNGKIIELQSYFLNLQITEEERLAKKAERERLKKEAMKATLESLPENERRAMERAMAEERKFSKAESERLERLKKAARKDRRLQEAKDNLYKSERFINHISKFNNVQESEMNTYILGMYNTLASRITKRIKANKAIEKDDIEFLTKLYNAIPEYQNTRYASDFPNPKKLK